MQKQVKRALGIFGAATFAVFSINSASAQSYSIYEIVSASPGGGSVAHALNNLPYPTVTYNPSMDAYVHYLGNNLRIGPEAGSGFYSESYAYSINDFNNAVGTYQTGGGSFRAIAWLPSARRTAILGNLGGTASALDINNANVAVGNASVSAPTWGYHGTVWFPTISTQAYDLNNYNLTTNTIDSANAINNHGSIVGTEVSQPYGPHQAYLIRNLGYTVLGGTQNFPTTYDITPTDINDNEIIIGYGRLSLSVVGEEALVWRTPSVATVLPRLQNANYRRPNAINNAGTIVGQEQYINGASGWEAAAAYFRNASSGSYTVVDLNRVSAPYIAGAQYNLSAAKDINQNGIILVEGTRTDGAVPHPVIVLLIPR